MKAKSFQDRAKAKIAAERIPGNALGNATSMRPRSRDAPETHAASSSDSGTIWKYCHMIRILSGKLIKQSDGWLMTKQACRPSEARGSADHLAQARQTPDVRPRKTRSPSRKTTPCRMPRTHTEIESKSLSDAYSQLKRLTLRLNFWRTFVPSDWGGGVTSASEAICTVPGLPMLEVLNSRIGMSGMGCADCYANDRDGRILLKNPAVRFCAQYTVASAREGASIIQFAPSG